MKLMPLTFAIATALPVATVIAVTAAAPGPALGAAAPARPRALADDPACTISLALPNSGHSLTLEYRQLGGDLSPLQEPAGADAAFLHRLQVLALLAGDGRFASDVDVGLGGRIVRAGSYPLGVTFGAGGVAHLFIAAGQESIPLPSQAFTPGWTSPRLNLQLVAVARGEVRLLWHLADKAGFVVLALAADAADGNRPQGAEGHDGHAGDAGEPGDERKPEAPRGGPPGEPADGPHAGQPGAPDSRP